MKRSSRKANLIYWVKRLKKGRTVSLEEDGSNLARAIEFGLSDPTALGLTVDLLIRLHPLLMRSTKIRDWITYYQVSTRRAEMLSSKTQAELSNQLGALNWQRGRNASALNQFRKGQELSKEQSLIQQEATALLGISLAKWAAHDFRSAFLEARRAVRRFRSKLSGHIVLSQLVAVKGITAYAAKEFGVAQTSFHEAMKMPGWQDTQSQIQFQINLALIDSNDHELYLAEKRLKRLSMRLENETNGHRFLGKIELLRAVFSYRKGDTDVALGILDRALTAGLLASPARESAWAESAMGRILLKRGTPKKGRAWLKSASLLWEKLNDPWMVLDTLQILDRIHTKQKGS